MNLKIRKGTPCELQVWDGCEEILNETNLFFSDRNELLEYLDKNLSDFKGKNIEYYLTQYIQEKGMITDLHLGHTVK